MSKGLTIWDRLVDCLLIPPALFLLLVGLVWFLLCEAARGVARRPGCLLVAWVALWVCLFAWFLTARAIGHRAGWEDDPPIRRSMQFIDGQYIGARHVVTDTPPSRKAAVALGGVAVIVAGVVYLRRRLRWSLTRWMRDDWQESL